MFMAILQSISIPLHVFLCVTLRQFLTPSVIAVLPRSHRQRVACEALIAAASKKDKCKSILTQGVDILKRLYQSKNDSIRVRALVGLCKVGSLGGTDALVRPFADGSTMKLAEACRRWVPEDGRGAG